MKPFTEKEDWAFNARLAEKINKYWADRGFVAGARVEPVASGNGGRRFEICSKLVNGLPTLRSPQ